MNPDPPVRRLAAVIETTHIAPDARKHIRVRAPLQVELAADKASGQPLDVVDWSPEGLWVSAVPAGLLEVAEGPVRVSALVEDTWVSFAARARVVREDPATGGAAIAFVGLPAPCEEVLHALAEAARAGEPPRLAKVLERSDPALVTVRAAGEGAPKLPPPKVAPKPPEPPRGWRLPLRSVVYIAIGLLLGIYVASTLYQRVWRIEVDAASLVAPTARIVSPADGLLREVQVSEGDRVAKDASVFLVESPSVQAALDRSALELGRARAKVAQLEATRDAEVERLAIQGRITRARLASGAAQLASLRERLAVADARVARLGELLGTGISDIDVETARAERAETVGELELVQGRVSTERVRLRATREGYAFDGDGPREGLPEAEAALAAARAELQLLEAQHDLQVVRADILQNGRAPFAGRVSSVMQTPGTPVRQGNVVVVLEQDEAARVEAWVTRHQAEYVRIGDIARVSVAGLGREYDAVVRSVEASAAASEELAHLGVDPRMRVLLDLQGYAGEPKTLADVRAELRDVDAVGLPVVVSFARSWR